MFLLRRQKIRQYGSHARSWKGYLWLCPALPSYVVCHHTNVGSVHIIDVPSFSCAGGLGCGPCRLEINSAPPAWHASSCLCKVGRQLCYRIFERLFSHESIFSIRFALTSWASSTLNAVPAVRTKVPKVYLTRPGDPWYGCQANIKRAVLMSFPFGLHDDCKTLHPKAHQNCR